MKKPAKPRNEEERLKALNKYNILDTLPEKEFDDITKLASYICQTPISLVSFIDPKRQWFKSHHGLGASETPREQAFCAHAILKPDEILVVPDSRKDKRFAENPLVTGEPHVIFYAGVPLITPEGFPLGTLCIIDNNPREVNQDQLEALKALADQVVNLLELRKSNLALETTKKELEQRNNNLLDFAYVVSHDIKSPLSQIIGLTNVAKMDYGKILDAKGNQVIDLINRSSLKLKALVDGILNYYSGDKILIDHKDDIELPDFFMEIIEFFKNENGESCQFEFTPEKHQLKINKTALEQILMNLIGNGIKYNEKENIQIKLAFRQDEKFYYFSVADNGMGISKEDQEEIFELFKHLSKKDRFGNLGTGVGLSTVKKLVERQNGQISVSSTVGEGSRFEFSIGR
ncbi:GAF domain-containing sensor histidine kinase [Flexithrix dorotheae]|uniref:GAF domain-containing sensor histidine kinase n=1 Tax=Flexithrix dorotheae TaxID=70993 RepID=UPI00037A1966|nr:ATP-binding protein [Flexithrix dorotheae]